MVGKYTWMKWRCVGIVSRVGLINLSMMEWYACTYFERVLLTIIHSSISPYFFSVWYVHNNVCCLAVSRTFSMCPWKTTKFNMFFKCEVYVSVDVPTFQVAMLIVIRNFNFSLDANFLDAGCLSTYACPVAHFTLCSVSSWISGCYYLDYFQSTKRCANCLPDSDGVD